MTSNHSKVIILAAGEGKRLHPLTLDKPKCMVEIFGKKRREVAVFERLVKSKINPKHHGFIDLFWPGMMIAEHKSAGKNLDEAMKQAEEYFMSLSAADKPRYLLACDFQNFRHLNNREMLTPIHSDFEL